MTCEKSNCKGQNVHEKCPSDAGRCLLSLKESVGLGADLPVAAFGSQGGSSLGTQLCSRSLYEPVNTTVTAGWLGHSQHPQRESPRQVLLPEPRGA